ncbi:MAG: class I tRNA ligase family protein, partial [Bacteroidales bacterium]
KGWKVEDKTQPTASSVAIKWINQKIDLIIENLDNQFAEYRLSEALMSLYKLIWDDFCSWYLEIIKPAYQDTIDSLTYFATINIFERLMQLLHPFMPFLTEEVWHILKDGETSECIALSKMPEPICKNKDLLDKFDLAQEVVTSIRTIRTDKNIPNKESLTLYIKENEDKVDTTFNDVICKLVNLDKIEYTNENVTETFTFVIKSTEYFVSAPSTVNIEEEIQKLKADLDYMKGFLKSVQKKLSNEKFVNNAPEKVVNLERKKQSDAEAKIAVLQEQINNLKAE